MMSIRMRLVIMCLAIALLPAIPLSFLVQSLLEKSFNVGLSDSVEDALKSGSDISREFFDKMRLSFEDHVLEVVTETVSDQGTIDSKSITSAFYAGTNISREAGGVLVARPTAAGPKEPARSGLPPGLLPFAASAEFNNILNQKDITSRRAVKPRHSEFIFYETEDRSILFALWRPEVQNEVQYPESPVSMPEIFLFYKKTDPEFLANADRLIGGRQIFAQLRLEQGLLSRSFFYPFIIIYGLILLFSLVLAFVMAERLASPIRRLVQGTRIVAGGDWSYRLRSSTRGEVGHLIDAFNVMVARLESQRKRLIDMEKMAAWREIARRLAHEIKNPLLPIRLTIEELKDQYKGEDKQYKEMLSESTRVVGDELNSLQKLVKEFSSFAKMPDMSPRMGSLEPLVRDVAKLYPHMPVRVEANPDLADFAFDPDQMRRVLVNLFDNSIAAIGAKKDGSIRIQLGQANGDAVIEFADTGPGISADKLPKIFDPYFTSKSEGTGLGLAMVKNIILLHGGSIEAESNEGSGTLFTITIPMRRDET
jgi:nitrogen fixation/metabolism regulation signal transduction histidine kinase